MLKRLCEITSHRMFIVFSAVVFAVGVTSYSRSSAYQNQSPQIEPARPYTVTYLESRINTAGVKTLTAVTVTEVDVEGNWSSTVRPIGREGWVKTEQDEHRQVNTSSKGHTSERSWPGVDAASVRKSREPFRTESFYTSSKNLVRTEMFQGLTVYVLKRAGESGEWVEITHSPKTGVVPLRLVSHEADGSEFRKEAVQIEFK